MNLPVFWCFLLGAFGLMHIFVREKPPPCYLVLSARGLWTDAYFCKGKAAVVMLKYVQTELQQRDSLFLFLARQPPSGPGSSPSRGFNNHTQLRATVGRTPLDE